MSSPQCRRGVGDSRVPRRPVAAIATLPSAAIRVRMLRHVAACACTAAVRVTVMAAPALQSSRYRCTCT